MSLDQAVNQAEQLISSGNHNEAINLLNQALGSGSSPSALITRAVAHIGNNDHERAIEDLKEASNQNPSHEERSKIDELIEYISKHVVNNLDQGSTGGGTRDFGGSGETGSRDLQGALLNGLMSGGSSGGSSQFSKLAMLATVFGASKTGGGGFNASSLAGLLSGGSGSQQQSSGGGLSSILSQFGGKPQQQQQQQSSSSGLGGLLSSLSGGGNKPNNNQYNDQYGGSNQYGGNQHGGNNQYGGQQQSSGGGLSGLLNQFSGSGNSGHGRKAKT